MECKAQEISNVSHKVAKISIILVTYHMADTIRLTLDSIFSQKYPDLELIVIDGKSTDDTVEILKANTDKISYWKSEADTGLYDAMNKGLDMVTGQWVYFIGADDVLLPGFSDMLYELTDPTAIYYANVLSNGVKCAGKQTGYRMAKFGIYHQAIIYPKAVFDRYRYDTRYRVSADFALTLTLWGDKNFHFVYKDYIIANFNHTGISSTMVDLAFQKDKARLILKNFGLKTWFRYRIHRYKHRYNSRA